MASPGQRSCSDLDYFHLVNFYFIYVDCAKMIETKFCAKTKAYSIPIPRKISFTKFRAYLAQEEPYPKSLAPVHQNKMKLRREKHSLFWTIMFTLSPHTIRSFRRYPFVNNSFIPNHLIKNFVLLVAHVLSSILNMNKQCSLLKLRFVFCWLMV